MLCLHIIHTRWLACALLLIANASTLLAAERVWVRPAPRPTWVRPAPRPAPRINIPPIINNDIHIIEQSGNSRNWQDDGNDDDFYHQPPRFVQPQPRFVQPQPQFVQPQPQFVQPQPQFVQPQFNFPTPPRNNLAPSPPTNRVTPARPRANRRPTFGGEKLTLTSAELVARQAIEAVKAGNILEDAVKDNIDKNEKKLSQAEKQKLKEDFKNAVDSEDAKELKKFLDENQDKLSVEAQRSLGTRIDVLKFQRDLEDDVLTDADKDARIAELQESAKTLKPAIAKKLSKYLNKMYKYQEFFKIATLTEGSDDSIEVLLEASNAAGFPPTFVSEITSLPIYIQPPVFNDYLSIESIFITNPERNKQAVNYSLDSHPYVMNPGEKQSLKKSCVISFAPGDGSFAKRYTLRSGVYEFEFHNNTWELRSIAPKIVLDNTQYGGTFNYLLNGKPLTLAAGATAEHSDSSPLVVEFDRGDGFQPLRKILTSGAYIVGINPKTKCLDLFDKTSSAEAIASSEAKANGSASSFRTPSFFAPISSVNVENNNLTKSANTKKKQIQDAIARLKAKAAPR